jgi:hypothetical protein
MVDVNNFVPEGGAKSYQLYELMRASDYVVLPYAGGWLDQPAWYIRDTEAFQLIEEHHSLVNKLPNAPGRKAPPQSKNETPADESSE